MSNALFASHCLEASWSAPKCLTWLLGTAGLISPPQRKNLPHRLLSTPQHLLSFIPGKKQEAARARYSAQMTKIVAKLMSNKRRLKDCAGRAGVLTLRFIPGFGRRAVKSLILVPCVLS